MWQKERGKYHLLLNYSTDVVDGRFLQTACGDMFQVRKRKQLAWVGDGHCPTCRGVWRLISTSVDDAKSSLKNESDLVVLDRASELTRSMALKKAIGARVRKLEKVADKERKLRLIQQAYD